MFKKKLLILAILLIPNFALPQTVDDLVKGPIVGFTYTPTVGKFIISADVVSLSTNSLFDENGDEITYNELMEGLADPEMAFSALYLSGEYSLNTNMGFSVRVPFVTKQELEMNPSSGWEEYLTDLAGETGLGDMTIGAWYFLSESQTNRLMALGRFTLSTGSSPDDVGESNLSSTGSGHSSFGVGAASDFMMASNILVSVAGHLTINNEASFSSEGYSWDQKDGNEIRFGGRVSYKASPQMSVGLDINYFSESETEVDGETIDDSNSNFMSIMPIAGYQLSSGTNTINFTGGYLLHINGENYPKFNGFSIGALIFF